MSHLMTRLARRCSGVAVAGSLAVAALVVPAAPASAARIPITADEQDYYSYYHLGQLRASGYTGRGVTIGLLDGPVNWKIPELQGADMQYMSRCDVESSDDSWEHGTVIAQVMVAPEFGIAPEARLNRYTVSLKGDTPSRDCAIGWWDDGYSDTSVLIELALNDGVDVVSISSTYSADSESMRWALARAITQKVPIVVSMGNDSEYNPPKSLARMTGVVGVASVEPNGELTSYSNYGDYVSTASVSRPYARSGATWEKGYWQGTSFASPTVASFLALARQSWPEATGNQLLQALARTGIGGNGGYWNPYTGYGAVDPYVLLTTDPSQFPDENPFLNKGYESIPTQRDIADYADGLVDPRRINADDSYQYRGFDERLTLSREHGYPTHLGTGPRFHASKASNAKKK